MERLRGSEGLDSFFQFNCQAFCAFWGVLGGETDADSALGFRGGKAQSKQNGRRLCGRGRTSGTRGDGVTVAVEFKNEILGDDAGDGYAGYVRRLIRCVSKREFKFTLKSLAEASDVGCRLVLILESDAKGGREANDSRDVERAGSTGVFLTAADLVGVGFVKNVRIPEIQHANSHGATEFVSREGGGFGLGEVEREFADDLGGVAVPGLGCGVEGTRFIAAGGENQGFRWVGVECMDLIGNDGDVFELCWDTKS